VISMLTIKMTGIDILVFILKNIVSELRKYNVCG